MMKKTVALLSLLLSLLLAKADSWTQKANYPGQGSSRTYFFSIDQKGYTGCGYNTGAYSDFWEYDPLTNSWSPKAPFAGGTAHSGTSFSILNKGYAGLGWIQNILSRSFWQYDPVTDSWTQVADFPSKRQSTINFVIDNTAYVGTGYDSVASVTSDFYAYDTVANTCTQKSNLPGAPRVRGIGFAIGSFGYAGLGANGNTCLYDFYKYDPVTDSWSTVSNYPGIAAWDMAAFTISGYGYMGTGQVYPPGNTVVNDFWKYDAVLDQWVQKTNFSGAARDESCFFSIGNKGYIGCGGVNAPLTGIYYSDFWEYSPDSTTGIEDIPSASDELQFAISPNPARDFIVISLTLSEKGNVEINITDMQGKKVYFTQLQAKTSRFKLQTSNFSNGIYFVHIDNGKEKAVKKFVKE